MSDSPAVSDSNTPSTASKPGPVPHTHPGYVGKCVLAPMVRTGELPTRLLALRYGCDMVWGPEVVDKGIIGSERRENEAADTVDFVKSGHNGKDQMVFRTHRTLEKERKKCIFQIGTANPELAVQGAKLVAADVAGVDVNAGCPKHFSIHSGMGAALLKTPETLTAILRSLITEVGKPFNIPISVKIRILDDLDSTLTLVRQLCETGVCRVTVHCRTAPMRPREAPIRDYLAAIADLCHSYNVACYANGDVRSRMHADEIISQYGVDGCMIAIAAEKNPSVFSTELARPWGEVVRNYLEYSQAIGHYFSNTKFCLNNLIPGAEEHGQKVTQAKSVLGVCEILGLPYKPLNAEIEKEDRESEEQAQALRAQKQKVKEAQEANRLKQAQGKAKVKQHNLQKNKEKQKRLNEEKKKGNAERQKSATPDRETQAVAGQKRKRGEGGKSMDREAGKSKKPEVAPEGPNAVDLSQPKKLVDAVAGQ
ncbi:FMN-linked oxidoreductase [Ascodesmis nigricans]|uniref:FMN-linked oxidoreductase n=1 Tax=Ascodesmis nigricans TaxID=341454 RepID=A0A4S2N3Y0_9PEZI|nr:FMN-linked oxidoreductase [Ascodesmis nigricans]